MLAAISASRALRSSACRLDPGCSLLAVSLSLIASKANRSSNGCSCPTRRRPDIGPSVAPYSENSHSPGVVPNSKGTTAKVVKALSKLAPLAASKQAGNKWQCPALWIRLEDFRTDQSGLSARSPRVALGPFLFECLRSGQSCRATNEPCRSKMKETGM